jgi:Homeodomain
MNTSTPEYTTTVKSTQPYNYTPPMPSYPDVTDSKAVDSESFNTGSSSQSEYIRDGCRPMPSAIVGSSSSSSNNNASGATPKKRTRATPEQLAVLEKTFMTNTSPNSRMRSNLAQELGMTERRYSPDHIHVM